MMKYPSSCFFQIMGGITRINSVPLVCLFRLDNMASAEIKSIISKIVQHSYPVPVSSSKVLNKASNSGYFSSGKRGETRNAEF